ncbi:Cupredoxin [Echria macrotheca]|uniref:Cupredoxin n=1 Tax=Echria macrotheca TaxID=438768 RepID=A0AAJ0F383_9PEZI|nr:Cupredoxin [Echria macrotheca]
MFTRLVCSLALASLALAGPLGRPKQFDLTVTWEKRAPNGFSRNMVLINGQSPGPLIEVDEGDEVWVTINNRMPFNTTIHFHGIEMGATPWSDGVPGVTQREIAPGKTFVSRWTAAQYGEYWYHAHHKGQLDDGQYGPIVIHPKKDRATPFGLISQDKDTLAAISKAIAHIKPLMLSDWLNFDSDKALEIQLASNMDVPCYDSMLINGKGKINCWPAEKYASLLSAQQQQMLKNGNATAVTVKGCLPKQVMALSLAFGKPVNYSAIPADVFDVCNPTQGSNTVIEVKKGGKCDDKNGTWVAFDVVGAYGTFTASFSIDGLPMYVYAVDGEYIEPQLVQAISVGNGDRYSFLVHITDAGDYTIRHANTLPIQIISGTATLSYRPSGQTVTPKNFTQYINDAGRALTPDVKFYNQTLQKSYPPSPVAQKADQTIILNMGNTVTGYLWSLNGTSQPQTQEQAEPVLFKPHPNALDNLTITTLNGSWVDLIFVATQVPQPAHPIHKHGNKMWLIGSGQGAFKWPSVEAAIKEVPLSFNLVNPPRRDGFQTLVAGKGPTWTAVRYHVTNPGPWLLHCHIQSHMLGGMSMVIQDGVDKWPVTPPEYLAYGA